MQPVVIIPPAEEPLSLEEVKTWLRIDHTEEDDLILGLIRSARQLAENELDRTLVATGFRWALDRWPDRGPLEIPNPPLVSVESVAYYDPAGQYQELEEFERVTGTPGLILPVYPRSWPALRPRPASVVVLYTAGYPRAAAVPDCVKTWMKLVIAASYEQRESLVIGTIVTEIPGLDAILAPAMWGAS